MKLTPDEKFMERAEERREQFESMSDEELQEEFESQINDRLERLERSMYDASKDAKAMDKDPIELAEKRIARFEEAQELAEEALSADFSREELLLNFIESRGPAYKAQSKI